MEFRKQALAKLQAPRQMDYPVQLARPRNLVALAVVAALIVVGAIWTGTGSIGRRINALGILTHAEGTIYMQSNYQGQITGVFGGTGSTFLPNTPLFTIQDGNKQYTIRSATGGRVINMFARVGQVIPRGTQLAVIERIENQSDPLVAMVYIAQSSTSLIHKGSQVDISVQSAPTNQYGVLRGTVQSIDQFPETEQQISNFLGDVQLARRFTRAGAPIGVIVKLTPGRHNIGFSWSTGSGPPFTIDSRSLVSAAIHLPPIKPVDWMMS
jgi:hypothetical protein